MTVSSAATCSCPSCSSGKPWATSTATPATQPRRTAEIGERFGERDLVALALQIQSMVRINQARVDDGLRLLDEAMVEVTAGEVSPFLTGAVYCGVIACCEEAFDVRRAREWTNALTRWCDAQPQMVSFTGRCLAHTAQASSS